MVEEFITLTKSQENYLKKYMPSDRVSTGIADYFCIFSDSTRVKIISALAIAEMCVGDLCYLLSQNQTTISHQLKILRDSKIVDYNRQGKLMVYSIVNPFVNDVMITGVDNFNRDCGQYSVMD